MLLRICLALLPVGFLLLLLRADPPSGRKPLEPPLTTADRAHWSFKRVARPTPPVVEQPATVANPIDAFALARLEKAGLTFAAHADRATLLRRVTLDLTGLPPTPHELNAFLKDDSPLAWERVVDRLLASPHYGEHWATHWLDVVRYADSNGYEADADRLHAWRYRDWVVRAFNQDMPYDRFLREQVAGDELAAGKEPREAADLLIASGFHRCGPVHQTSGFVDNEAGRQEVLTEMTTSIGAVLGLTVQCARCHDHKFDPVSQADYYRLQAFFTGTVYKETDIASPQERDRHEAEVAALRQQREPVAKQLGDLEAPYRKALVEKKRAALEPLFRTALEMPTEKRSDRDKKLASDAQILIKVTWDEILTAMTPADRKTKAALRQQIHAIDARMPPPPARAWCVGNKENPPPTHLLVRGDPKRKGAEVTAAFPRVLLPEGAGPPQSSRIALANWLTARENPLPARVFVNRIWQHHFGRPLVGTPNDFGINGQRPTHPELLDWLADEFVRSGWSVKHLHRLMLTSSVYQQVSQADNPAARKVDPDNKLLWRMNRQRLSAEALRDAILATAGTLTRKVGGPPVRVPLEREVYELIFTEGEPDGLWHAAPDPREHRRRTLYLLNKRNVRLPLLEAFDQPDTLTPCPIRSVSTFAPQALILLNGPFAQEQSRAFALRLLRECGPHSDRLVERGYLLAFGRPAREKEVESGKAFLRAQAELLRGRLKAGEEVGLPSDFPIGIEPALAGALSDFCLALLNANEFIYVK